MKDKIPHSDTMGIMYEKRPLKRPRLGPPDVYPQEPRQKEDELTSANVKHGFTTTPQSSDEFGTARNFNYSASKIGQFFSGILSKKEELNTLPDCGRKRQQVNPKDNFWPATARTKPQIEAWFKDLAGNKPLSQLAKKAPNFNKKEEIFITLTEYQVAMPRAAWFIKLSSAYTVAVSEAKIKKRQLPDPTTEWTTTLIKFLKDQIPKLAEYYQNATPGNISDKTPPSQSGQGTPSHNSSGNPPGGTTPNSSTVPNSMHSPGNSSGLGSSTPNSNDSTDWRQALRQWNYCCRLARYLLDEGLLDRHDFLTWIIELLDKRAPDDGLLKLFLPLALQHMSEFVCCEGLSRRLATSCAKKAAAICSVLSDTTLRTLNQPTIYNKTNDRNGEANGTPMSPNNEANGDVKPNVSQIKRSTTPADTNQGTPNPNHSLGTPNPNHSLGTPNPMGTPNPQQTMDVQVKEEAASSPRDTKATLTTVIASAMNPVQVGFGEILNCSFHRDVIIQLATILQIICIECPTALVWSGCGSALAGSPLDLLPVPPSALPMPQMDSALTEEHRRMVYEAEQEISARSKKAESKWCTDKWQTSSQARVLAVLEALDRHSFDRVDPNNNLDTLYKEVFANCTPPSKDGNPDPKDPEWACSYSVVRVLCEWAVCGARWGEHRAMAAAALLDRRQHHHHHHDHQGLDDKESISSGTGLYNGPPLFQNLLLRFLDNDAPILDESPNAPPGNRQQFANLVHLFGELIRRDVFSHDAYMCTLISRGDLISPTEPTSTGTSASHTVAPPANSTGTNHNMDDDIFAGIDLKPKMEVLKANPPRLVSNINFVTRFCNAQRLMTGEGGYYFTNLCCAVSFIENLNAESLNMDKKEFDCYMAMPASIGGSTWAAALSLCGAVREAEEQKEQIEKLMEEVKTLRSESELLATNAETFEKEIAKKVQDVLAKTPLEIKPRREPPRLASLRNSATLIDLSTPEVQQSEDVPKNQIPQMSEISSMSEIPQMQEIPQMSELSQLSEIPQMPEIAQISEISQMSEISRMSEIPQISQMPEIPEISQITETPQISQMPEINPEPIQPILIFEDKPSPSKSPQNQWDLKQTGSYELLTPSPLGFTPFDSRSIDELMTPDEFGSDHLAPGLSNINYDIDLSDFSGDNSLAEDAKEPKDPFSPDGLKKFDPFQPHTSQDCKVLEKFDEFSLIDPKTNETSESFEVVHRSEEASRDPFSPVQKETSILDDSGSPSAECFLPSPMLPQTSKPK